MRGTVAESVRGDPGFSGEILSFKCLGVESHGLYAPVHVMYWCDLACNDRVQVTSRHSGPKGVIRMPRVSCVMLGG